MGKWRALRAMVATLGSLGGSVIAMPGTVVGAAAVPGGINLIGAEFSIDQNGVAAGPQVYGEYWIYPTRENAYTQAAYYRQSGMRYARLPLRWERIQPKLGEDFDPAEASRLATAVSELASEGFSVIIDVHNYGRYWQDRIGSGAVTPAHFADLWRRLATSFKDKPTVVFGIMNEPFGFATEEWRSIAQAAVDAIRATDAGNLILVPGNAYSGASQWLENWYGTPNGPAMAHLRDPKDNMAFEVHQYLDGNQDGTGDVCTADGGTVLAAFTQWLRRNGRRGFLGEFGGSADPSCLAAIDRMLAYINANADVWVGWTVWADGPWWKWASYNVGPRPDGQNSPQMEVLKKHLPGATP
jgi:endoglucanase